MRKRSAAGLLAVCSALVSAGVSDAFATALEYKLFVVDSNGNSVSGLKTQATIAGVVPVPLIGELQIDGLTMIVNDNDIRLSGNVTTCIGSNGCGSQYANQPFSFNTQYGVPVGTGHGPLNATLTNQLAGS